MLKKEKKIYPVEIGVCRVRHIIINYNVDTLNVNAPAHQVGCNEYPLVPFLEALVLCQSAKDQSSVLF